MKNIKKLYLWLIIICLIIPLCGCGSTYQEIRTNNNLEMRSGYTMVKNSKGYSLFAGIEVSNLNTDLYVDEVKIRVSVYDANRTLIKSQDVMISEIAPNSTDAGSVFFYFSQEPVKVDFDLLQDEVYFYEYSRFNKGITPPKIEDIKISKIDDNNSKMTGKIKIRNNKIKRCNLSVIFHDEKNRIISGISNTLNLTDNKDGISDFEIQFPNEIYSDNFMIYQWLYDF